MAKGSLADESVLSEKEQERRRDEALRRALAMPPVGKAGRSGGAKQVLSDLIQQASAVRAEVAALRRDSSPHDQGERSRR